MHPYRTTTINTLVLVLSLTVICSTVFADDLSGTLAGRVLNFDGDRGVRKVKVTLTSPDDPSFRAETITDREGYFTIPVENAKIGFEAFLVRRGYAVLQTTVNLKPGEPNERFFTMLTMEEVDEGKDEILREREQAATMDPAAELYNEGIEALAAGYAGTARDRFRAALEYDENMAPALSGLSLIALQREQWTEAAEFSGRTLALNSDDPIALFVAYRANKVLGDDEKAAQALARLNITGGNVDAAARIFNEGADAYRSEDYDEAKNRFLEAIEFDPTLPEAYAALAAVQLADGQIDDALENAETVLGLDPENALALKIRFEASLAGNKEGLAVAMGDYAAIEGQYVSQRVNQRAFELFEENKYDEARKLVNLVLRVNWDDPRANYILGLILVNAGDNRGAREHLEKFIELAPEKDPDVDAARAMLEAIE